MGGLAEFPSHAGRRVAIIGGGAAGLVSAKTALECGLTPVGFESSASLGGLWRPRAEGGAMWDSLRCQTSYATCAVSDFPWPRPTAAFPTAQEMQRYLMDFASAFKLQRHFRFNCRVQRVEQLQDGRWRLAWRASGSKEEAAASEAEEDFDFLLVCSGVLSVPDRPDAPAGFRGQQLHSSEYRNPAPFKGQRVVVMGAAYSGCEIAVDLCSDKSEATSVTLVSRTPQWVVPRYVPDTSADGEVLPASKPVELAFFNRASAAHLASLPAAEADKLRYSIMSAYTQQERLLPQHMRVTAATTVPPTRTCVSDLRPAVESGRLSFAPAQSASLADADVIIWCTGYRASLPFFSDAVLAQLALCDVRLVQPLLLHGTVWPPASLPNLAFIGLYRGAFVGLMELQARWACMAFAALDGTAQPSAEERQAGIDAERRMRATRQCGQSLLWQYVGLCEFLAEQIGVKPRTDAAAQAADPELHRLLLHGALVPASYRLQGFAANPKQARAELLRVQEEQNERRKQHEMYSRQ